MGKVEYMCGASVLYCTVLYYDTLSNWTAQKQSGLGGKHLWNACLLYLCKLDLLLCLLHKIVAEFRISKIEINILVIMETECLGIIVSFKMHN